MVPRNQNHRDKQDNSSPPRMPIHVDTEGGHNPRPSNNRELRVYQLQRNYQLELLLRRRPQSLQFHPDSPSSPSMRRTTLMVVRFSFSADQQSPKSWRGWRSTRLQA